jgi:hypothetical protein
MLYTKNEQKTTTQEARKKERAMEKGYGQCLEFGMGCWVEGWGFGEYVVRWIRVDPG